MKCQQRTGHENIQGSGRNKKKTKHNKKGKPENEAECERRIKIKKYCKNNTCMLKSPRGTDDCCTNEAKRKTEKKTPEEERSKSTARQKKILLGVH